MLCATHHHEEEDVVHHHEEEEEAEAVHHPEEEAVHHHKERSKREEDCACTSSLCKWYSINLGKSKFRNRNDRAKKIKGMTDR